MNLEYARRVVRRGCSGVFEDRAAVFFQINEEKMNVGERPSPKQM
jgi:hypothetical protein